MNPAYPWVALALASYRGWRVLGRDEITEPIRRRLPNALAKPTACEWCLGAWFTFVAFALTHLFVIDLITGTIHNRTGVIALFAAAGSCVVGLIGTAVDK